MPILPDDPALIEKKGPGHAQWIPDHLPQSETTDNCRFKPTPPDPGIKYFTKTSAPKAEFTVEGGFRIAETGDITISPACKKTFGLFFGSHMNERDPRSCRFDRLAAELDRCQGLATEGSAIVAEEDNQYRLAGGHLLESLTVLIANFRDDLFHDCSSDGLSRSTIRVNRQSGIGEQNQDDPDQIREEKVDDLE